MDGGRDVGRDGGRDGEGKEKGTKPRGGRGSGGKGE